jgi:malate synthase
MSGYVDRAGLKVASVLADFLELKALPGTGIDADAFWIGTAAIFASFTPRNRALLQKRNDLQANIDAWHKLRPTRPS